MFKYWSAGWKMTLWNPFLIVLLFVYQWIWGIVLYQFVQSVALPLLYRYPGKEQAQELHVLFWAESQFSLMKTNVAAPYLLTLAAILLVRIILTPLLDAGILDSIHQTHVDGKRSFFKGVRRLGGRFFLLYLLQLAITLVPIYWIWPVAEREWPYLLHGNLNFYWIAMAAGMYIYAAVIKLIFLYARLGLTTENSLFKPLGTMFRHLIPIVGISISMAALYVVLASISISTSMIYAGMFAIMLHQLFHLVKVIFRLWHISTQHQYLMTHNR